MLYLFQRFNPLRIIEFPLEIYSFFFFLLFICTGQGEGQISGEIAVFWGQEKESSIKMKIELKNS